ncbi:hypothetical protein Cylst_1662 [Cylindrospermum stagnale PCC 7417]|uniref:Uncharacterized protein n=1 Tax=Cylindrospermum stagnale PCC 7417 TaxID=56107 RepID=K9WWN4_9NOST|nr:hypothetical protein Cylst_1662 [Cylindrospermum stagnale PCC 7417]
MVLAYEDFIFEPGLFSHHSNNQAIAVGTAPSSLGCAVRIRAIAIL